MIIQYYGGYREVEFTEENEFVVPFKRPVNKDIRERVVRPGIVRMVSTTTVVVRRDEWLQTASLTCVGLNKLSNFCVRKPETCVHQRLLDGFTT